MGSPGGMLAIVGPSGCGKSSLVNAAVVPLLDSDPAWLTVALRLVPGSDPLPELARALAATANRVGMGSSTSDVRGVLEGGADADGLRRVAGDLLAAAQSRTSGCLGRSTRPRSCSAGRPRMPGSDLRSCWASRWAV